jgi:hypothetical protein
MNKIITSGAFLVVTDYNFLPLDVKTSWVEEYTDNYLIYDRAHRYEETNKIIHQENVGANIYDIFDFISNNYNNLPETIIFCKGNVIPRHCGYEKFKNIINNTTFTTIENYIRETPRYSQGIYSFVTENDEYHETPIEVNATVARIHKCKYIFSYQGMLEEIFENAIVGEYIRFAPGANHIIPKSDILKYNKNFYLKMREYVSWHVQPGEAYLLERALFTLFNNPFNIREKYKNEIRSII